MQIEVNGAQRTVDASQLDEVLIELGFRNQAVATAVNGNFVPTTQRATRTLVAGDRVEVLAPMQGG